MEGKRLYFDKDGDVSVLHGMCVAVLGFGNQGRAQALNLRDSGIEVIIGAEDASRQRAGDDGFEVFDFATAVQKADIIFILLPDEIIPEVYTSRINANLRSGSVLCFASGYTVAFNLIELRNDIDIIMIAPRMIGVGVREKYVSGDGFFSFITVHRDASGKAQQILLGLAKALGTLKKAGIDVSMKQEAVLDLFNEQAFGPAFGRVLLTAIDVLIDNGMPPEAVLTEMYLSEEMSYTYQKMAQVGIVRQLQFHSHTSQYGAMSRGIRYMGLPLKKKFQETFREIDSGSFAREWEQPFSKLKLKVIRYFATRQKIQRIEKQVKENLGLPIWEDTVDAAEVEKLLADPNIREQLGDLFDNMEF